MENYCSLNTKCVFRLTTTQVTNTELMMFNPPAMVHQEGGIQNRLHRSDYLFLQLCFPSVLCLFQCVHALLCTAGGECSSFELSEAYSGRFISPPLSLLGAWRKQLWRDTATNRLSKYGGLQSRENAWSNFGPLRQTASIEGTRQKRDWTVYDTFCWNMCVLSVCSCLLMWVCAC